MAKRIGKVSNVTDDSTHTTVSVGSSVAVTLLIADPDALLSQEMEVLITNNGNKPLWVRRRAASTDNIKDGRRISPGESRAVVNQGDLFVGEISAIFDSGGARDVMVETI